MKKQTSIVLATTVLLSGVTAASAATMSNSAKASDTLSLTSTQQKTAWNDLYVPSLNQKAPSGFHAIIGAVVLKPYNFAMMQKKLVIVNPSDKKIVEVMTR